MTVKYERPQMKYPEQKGMISIIVPIYNNEVYLRECLDSILAQTFGNWEAILVNDGSTDNTGMIVDEYAQKDSRFIAIHKRNEGTLLARKTGIEISRGEFVASIDHDDTYNPQFLEKMYSTITETNTDFVWCQCQVTEKGHTYYITDYKWTSDISENVAMTLTIGLGTNNFLWNRLIKRTVYEKVAFPNIRLIVGEDPVQTIQIAYYSKSAAFVSDCLYFHRLKVGNSLTKDAFSHDTFFTYVSTINKTLENIFNNCVPKKVRSAFDMRFNKENVILKTYINSDRKLRKKFKTCLKPLLMRYVKKEIKINHRICLLLAINGIRFPFILRQKLYQKYNCYIKNESRKYGYRFIMRHNGFCPICDNGVTFEMYNNDMLVVCNNIDWMRERFICSNCGSIPRERALIAIIERHYPNWRNLKIHESSPGDRSITQKFKKECSGYIGSQYYPKDEFGKIINGYRNENLEHQTFDDKTFDIVITQDVFEHIYNPDKAFSEIGRTLKDGGAHIFTVPIVNKFDSTEVWAKMGHNGEPIFQKAEEWHGNPIDEKGAPVTMHWGYDIVNFIKKHSGLDTTIEYIHDPHLGIVWFEHKEILVSKK